MPKEWPYVYEKSDGRWCVDTGTKRGKRRRAHFQSQSEAQAEASAWEKEYAQGGSVAFMLDDQRLDAVNAYRLFEKRGIHGTLTEAVQFFLDRKYPLGGNLSVSTALDAYLKEKAADRDLSQVYRWSLNRLERLRDAFADTKLSELDGQQLNTFIRTNKAWAAESQRQHYIYFRMFLRWCVRRHHLAVNPLDDIKPPKGNQESPGILDMQDVRTMLTSAWNLVQEVAEGGFNCPAEENAHEYREHRVFPYLVLGLYLGIRPHEISRLRWRDFTERFEYLHIHKSVSKTSDKRVVPVPLAAQVMLVEYERVMAGRTYVNPELKVIQGDYAWMRKRMLDWRTELGVTKWPHDCMRHTFASYFLAAHSTMHELMSRMGHSSSRTTLKNYVELVDSAEWKDYWIWTPEALLPKLHAQIPKEEKNIKTAVLRLPT